MRTLQKQAFRRGNPQLTLWGNYVPEEVWPRPWPMSLVPDRFFTLYLGADTLICGTARGESKDAA
jgi:hypothetical protein